jgi:hypothetical protein
MFCVCPYFIGDELVLIGGSFNIKLSINENIGKKTNNKRIEFTFIKL